MSVNEKMTAIANAIRNKTEKQGLLGLDDMATEIPSVYDKGFSAGVESVHSNEPMHSARPYDFFYRGLSGVKIEAEQIDERGFNYFHAVPTNTTDKIYINWYTQKRFPVVDGTLYFKWLIRTNVPVLLDASNRFLGPLIAVYQTKDGNGNNVNLGAPYAMGVTSIEGNGEWEEITLRITDIPKSVVSFSQLTLYFAGVYTTGNQFYDSNGNLMNNTYFDIASWAVFPNEKSASSYNLLEAMIRDANKQV